MKPFIGINSSVSVSETGIHRFCISGNYTDAILKAGGIPLILTASSEPGIIEVYLGQVKALLLVGGGDLEPSLYADITKLATVKRSPVIRQEFDLAITRAALARDLPVMGICMGCQVLNVAAGGTLYQDIEQQVNGHFVRHYQKIAPYYVSHSIRIECDSLLYRIIKKEELAVNSAHHQSVKKPGDGFRPVAFSEDGIVECIEGTKNRFALGVQWHPEVIHQRPEQLSLFRALVSAASGEAF